MYICRTSSFRGFLEGAKARHIWVMQVYVCLPISYFPPSFDCVSLGHTTMTHILAQRVWISFSGRVIITCTHSRINTCGLLTSNSRVRIERLAPEKWTADDVGVWLDNEVCICIRSDSICSVDLACSPCGWCNCQKHVSLHTNISTCTLISTHYNSIGQVKLAQNKHANMACTRTHAQLWKCILKSIGLFSEIVTMTSLK